MHIIAPVGDRRQSGVLFVPQLLHRVSAPKLLESENQKTNLQECPRNEVSFWDLGDDDSLSEADAFISPDA